jgi:hypothetical protein
MPRDLATLATTAAEACGPPAIWNRLTQEDHAEYFRVKLQLHQAQRPVGDDHRIMGFHKELLTALSFIERRPEGKEERSIIAGVAFAGPYICVNTRQLKAFLGRCKSSINGSFMEMGYTALRIKSKARSCVLSCLHTLIDDVTNLRQWTVRCASRSALFCICSSFTDRERPEIYESDLGQPTKSAGPRVIVPIARPVKVPAEVACAAWIPEMDRSSCFDGIDLVPNWDLPSLDSFCENDLRPNARADLLCIFDDFHVE